MSSTMPRFFCGASRLTVTYDRVVSCSTENPSLLVAADLGGRQRRCRDRGQPRVPSSEPCGLSDEIAAGAKRQIRPQRHRS